MISPTLYARFPSGRYSWRARCAGLIALLLHIVMIKYLLQATGFVTLPSRPDQTGQPPLQLLTLILLPQPGNQAARASANRQPPVKPLLEHGVTRPTSRATTAPATQALNPPIVPQTVAPLQAITVTPSQSMTSGGASTAPNWRSDLDAIAQPRHNFAQQPSWTAGAPASSPQVGNPAVAAFGRAVAQGARTDCQSAYRPLGLLAIPKLLLDTATNTGCRWN